MKPAFFDKAIRILVEGHGSKRVRDTIGSIIAHDAQMRRRAKPPVLILVVGAGVNVTQEAR